MDTELGRPLTICLFVEHSFHEISHSLYKIELPVDLSDYQEDELIDSKGRVTESKSVVHPIANFPHAGAELLSKPEMANLGSKIYFFGGLSHHQFYGTRKDEKLLKAVHVLDMNQPEQGLYAVAPLNAAKEKPCVFIADGMIYALGSAIELKPRLIPGCEGTGCFERYDPNSDKWQVLPDPPIGYRSLVSTTWFSYPTVVGRYVFFGGQNFFHDECNYVIYNLDSQKWEKTPPRELAERFPYGSPFVNGYLYILIGGTTCFSRTRVWDDYPEYVSEPVHIVKRGPLTITDGEGKCDFSSFLKSEGLDSENAQVVARAEVLDDNHKSLFTKSGFYPWRSLIHLGGCYFCYVVTAPLVECTRTRDVVYDEYIRCVRIKVFKEVIYGKNNKARMRLIASLLYRLHNPAPPPWLNQNRIICCALGAIPNTWSMGPWKKKENREIANLENLVADESKGKCKVREELANLQELLADESDGKHKLLLEELANLKKLLQNQEERINWLMNEIARMRGP